MKYRRVLATTISLLFLTCLFAGSAEAANAERNCDPSAPENLEYVEHHRQTYGKVKPLPGCPGYDDVDPGYANFAVNGVMLRIPRAYLRVNFDEADGATDGAFLAFSVPLFEPISKMQANQIIETATFTVTGANKYCSGEDCYSFLEKRLFELITGLSFYTHPDETVRKAQEIIKVNAVEKKTRGYFRLSGKGYEAAFHRQDDGDITEWFFCDKTETYCHSIYLFRDKVLIYLNLRHATLKQMAYYKHLFQSKFMSKIVVESED